MFWVKLGGEGKMLDTQQMRFFKTNGYLILRGAMDSTLCQRVRDVMWQALPTDVSLRREDPRGGESAVRCRGYSESSAHGREWFSVG